MGNIRTLNGFARIVHKMFKGVSCKVTRWKEFEGARDSKVIYEASLGEGVYLVREAVATGVHPAWFLVFRENNEVVRSQALRDHEFQGDAFAAILTRYRDRVEVSKQAYLRDLRLLQKLDRILDIPDPVKDLKVEYLSETVLLSDKTHVCDPCYTELHDRCILNIPTVPGEWQITLYRVDEGAKPLYFRATCRADHEIVARKAFSYDVDSGQVCLCSAETYRKDDVAERWIANNKLDIERDTSTEPGRVFYVLACHNTLKTHYGFLPGGFAMATYYGDGTYTAVVRYNAKHQAVDIFVMTVGEDAV